MGFVIFFVFIFVWYFPAYVRQGKIGKPAGKHYILAILFGALPVMLAALILQIALTRLYRVLGVPSGTLHYALESFISAAAVEELLKFFFAWLIIRKVRPERQIDYALLFGAVGMGFEITESLMGMDSVLAAVIRGVFAYHILWQFWMGLYYRKYRQAREAENASGKVKYFILTFLVPTLLHGINDFIAFMAEAAMDANNENAMAFWTLGYIVYILFSIVYLIFTMRNIRRAVSESRQLTEVPAEEAAP